MPILYNNVRNVTFVLFTKTSNSSFVGPLFPVLIESGVGPCVLNDNNQAQFCVLHRYTIPIYPHFPIQMRRTQKENENENEN